VLNVVAMIGAIDKKTMRSLFFSWFSEIAWMRLFLCFLILKVCLENDVIIAPSWHSKNSHNGCASKLHLPYKLWLPEVFLKLF
jgi:hypothetical protein